MAKVLYLLRYLHKCRIVWTVYTYTAITALASFVCYDNHLHPLPQVLLQKTERFRFNCYFYKERKTVYV